MGIIIAVDIKEGGVCPGIIDGIDQELSGWEAHAEIFGVGIKGLRPAHHQFEGATVIGHAVTFSAKVIYVELIRIVNDAFPVKSAAGSQRA